MKPTVFLDVDELVASLHPALYAAHGRVYDPETEIKGRAAWDLERLFGISWEELWKPVTYEMIFNLPKTPEADKIVELLSPPDRPWDLIFLTSPMPVHIDARHQWLKKNWPDIPRVYTSLKYLCCKGPHTLLIDDFDDNCDRWEKEGGPTIRFPRAWNVRWKHEPRYFPDRFLTEFKDWVWSTLDNYFEPYERYCDAVQNQP